MRTVGWVGIGAVMVAVLAFLIIDSAEDGTGSAAGRGVVKAPAPTGISAVDALRSSVPLPDVHVNPPPRKQRGPRFALVTVKAGHTIALRASPGGKVLKRVGDRTEFGSRRVYWIAQVRGAWFGVPTPDLPNNQLAWIRDDRFALNVSQTRFWISADISRRQIELHHGNRILERIEVTVGSNSTPTPLGDYSVTDGLVGRGVGPWYGCCVLALSGHQDNLPAGWIGGNRIAIHGTPGSIGGAESHGCLRASDPDMIALFARVPLGAPVFIRA